MSGYREQIEQGRVLALLPQHKNRVEEAQLDIFVLNWHCNRPYVSVSWGKDSIVLAHLALSVDPHLTLVHWGSEQERHIANFDQVRDNFLQRFGRECRYIEVADERLMTGKLSINGRAWSRENGFDGVLMGLTAEESRARRFALGRADVHNIYTYADGMKRCCPLANWTVEDITAYVADHGLQMLNLYERYGMQIRTSSRIKRDGLTRQGLEYCTSTAQEAVMASWAE